jgi:hypothetical protein
MYGICYMFGITLPSSGSVPSAFSQNALGTLPEDENVMPKHVEDTHIIKNLKNN